MAAVRVVYSFSYHENALVNMRINGITVAKDETNFKRCFVFEDRATIVIHDSKNRTTAHSYFRYNGSSGQPGTADIPALCKYDNRERQKTDQWANNKTRQRKRENETDKKANKEGFKPQKNTHEIIQPINHNRRNSQCRVKEMA